MSYQTGPSTSPVALLDSFVTFMVAAGWTQDAYVVDGTGKRAHMHKGTKYVHLRSFINENSSYLGASPVGSGIAVTGATGYSGATPWWRQPNAPYQYLADPNVDVWTGIMSLPAGSIQSYWMFADVAGDNVYLVAIKQSGVYSFLGFGDIIKPQAYTGGFFMVAPRYNILGQGHSSGQGVDAQSEPPGAVTGFFKADVDTWTTKWNNITTAVPGVGVFTTGKRVNSSTGLAIAADHIRSTALYARARSERTGALLLLPTLWLVERDFGGTLTGGGWSLVGQVPDVFRTKTTGFVPGSQYDISTDQYIVFPDFVIRKYP